MVKIPTCFFICMVENPCQFLRCWQKKEYYCTLPLSAVLKRGFTVLHALLFVCTLFCLNPLLACSEAQRYGGFVVTKSMPIEDIQCHLVELKHLKSGAEVIHIQNDDPVN